MGKKRKKERTSLYSKFIKDQETVLGLDCSSNTIGWGIISVHDNHTMLVAHGHFKPLGSEFSELERLDHTYNKITELCETFRPNCVAVEDIFLFMKGKSRAQTITVLTAFNRVSSLAAYKSTKNVSFYSVHQIRKIIKHFCNIDETIPKDGMPDVIRKYLCARFSNILNTRNNIAKETYDEADGIAAAWAGVLHIMHPDRVESLLEVKRKGKK